MILAPHSIQRNSWTQHFSPFKMQIFRCFVILMSVKFMKFTRNLRIIINYAKKLADTHSYKCHPISCVCLLYEFKIVQQNAYLHCKGFEPYHVGKISSKQIYMANTMLFHTRVKYIKIVNNFILCYAKYVLFSFVFKWYTDTNIHNTIFTRVKQTIYRFFQVFSVWS